MTTEKRKQADAQRKLRTRQALLDAAAAVFERNGYHRTLISDIVAQASLGQGTFYRNFESKREIFEVLMDDLTSRLLDAFSGMSANPPRTVAEYRDGSISAMVRVARTVDSHRQLFQLFLREAPSIDREFADRLQALYHQFAQLAKFYLDHAIAHGLARPCHSEVVAQSLVGIGLRLIHLWWDGYFGELTLEDLIREVADLALMGFGPQGPFKDRRHDDVGGKVGEA